MEDSVSKRYAVALLSLAREENKTKEYIEEVKQIVSIMNNNPDLEKILSNQGLSLDEKKETIDLLFKGKIIENILNLFYVVLDNQRGNIIKNILNEFIKESNLDLNIKTGFVYSTNKLDNKTINKLEKKVSSLINSNVTLENIIDDDLIGGFKIVVDDYVIDESIKNRLNEMKDNLKGDIKYGN